MATKLKPVDVVVVGAGIAGTIVAKELAETGIEVLCLERGRMIGGVVRYAGQDDRRQYAEKQRHAGKERK